MRVLFYAFFFLCLLGACHSNNSHQKLASSVEHSSMSSLPFSIQKQSALSLCWAAVASSVSKFYNANSQFAQCKLANSAFNSTTCCQNLNNCDNSWFLDKALKLTDNFVSVTAGVPTLDVLRNQITNGRLVCVRIEWRSGAGHFVVIYGVHNDGKLDVADPWPDKNPEPLTLTELELFYRDLGSITHYYLTKPEF